MQEKYFTDSEYRILLRALSREKEVCEQVDKDCGEEHKLIRIMNSIEKKIKNVQYPPKKECLKQTNAYKIRSMSNEELAEFLPIVSNYMCQPTDECLNIICDRGECSKVKECALRWLQSKVEE